MHPTDSELGKKSAYISTYDPTKLFPIARKNKRAELGITDKLPFYGVDIWNHYEVSWLNGKGKPIAAIAEISHSCDTPYLIESKSMKLYFNSLNNTTFQNIQQVVSLVEKDLSHYLQGPVTVKITPLTEMQDDTLHHSMQGLCLDNLDIDCSSYTVDPSFLRTNSTEVEETVYSHLLKSNCLVTSQPDWGSVQINYQGKQIDHEDLLRYIVSFRDHVEFGEHCIERIFTDIMRHCAPQKLTVYGRYTRRGGLDINPLRSTSVVDFSKLNQRLARQ